MAASCSAPVASSTGADREGGPSAPRAPSSARVSLARQAAGPTVLVTGPGGESLAGVEVWLVDPRSVDPERAVIASRTLGDWVEASRAVATEVLSTDDRGLAHFEARCEEGFLVAARRDALFGLVERVVPLPPKEQVPLQLLARAAYPVRVVDASGAPARGVALTLAAPDPATPDESFALPSSAFTDERGLATLYEPPPVATGVFEGLDQVPERVAILRIPVGGLAPVPLAPGGERVNVELPPLQPIELRCQHAAFSEDHWAGLVQVFLASDGSRSERTLAQAFEAGRIRLPYASRREDLRLHAVISEAAAPGRFIGMLTLDAPATGVIDLPLDEGLIVTGRCVDAEGSALADQTIDLFVVGDASTAWTLVTDGEGRFRWLLLRPGKALARVVIGARTRGTGPPKKSTKRLGDVSAGEVVDVGVLTLR
ncbi:hypothetical protein Poly30_09190 [Planctomycetes bacterium Poly30]|uniref:Uncharacterized protein n=2 Tax=Saltatorellus ferox TaxID=2528018 RepID=A0A518EMV7_9BACT|nr:hypothetical protein Poly30_09190 [Planctomycetes bacterium Poly30]